MNYNLYREKHIKSWDEFSKLVSDFKDYGAHIYRGHSVHNWDLETTLKRALKRSKKEEQYYINGEHWTLYEFKRRAHLYKDDLPGGGDILSWFALMQHHGAPTRLLDFTHSIFIAAYFALINADQDAAIWSINQNWLRSSSLRLSGVQRDFLDGKMRDDDIQQINNFGNNYLSAILKSHKAIQRNNNNIKVGSLFVEPVKQTKRLAIQQGVFVMPLDLRKPFLENLKRLHDNTYHDFSQDLKNHVTKIRIQHKARYKILAKLKEMNITAESLFPGIDGFAGSLEHTQLAT